MIGIFVFWSFYFNGKQIVFIFFTLVVHLPITMLKIQNKPILVSSLILANLFLYSSCKKDEPVDLRITTLTKEEIAVQLEVAQKSISPQLKEGLKLEVWAVDSLVRDPIGIQVNDEGEVLYTRSPRRNNS